MVIKTGELAPVVTLPPQKWRFFENVLLNEAIWCTIFHHVKHLTAHLLGCLFTLEQDGQKKWRGHTPKSEK